MIHVASLRGQVSFLMIRNRSRKKKVLPSAEGMGHGAGAGPLRGASWVTFSGLPAGSLGSHTTLHPCLAGSGHCDEKAY